MYIHRIKTQINIICLNYPYFVIVFVKYCPLIIRIIQLREGISCDIGAIGDIATACGQRLKLEDIEKLGEGTEGMGLAGTFSRRIKAGYGYGSTMSPLSSGILIKNPLIRRFSL